ASLVVAASLPLVQSHVGRTWGDLTAMPTPQRIATGRGEQQSALLPDGSQLELGGDTGVKLEFTPQQRLIEAQEGEIFYRVKHDAKRPFVVRAGPVIVTAIGTAFSVRRESGTVSVVVAEGVVEVEDSGVTGGREPIRAAAGQRVRFDQGKLTP